MKVKTIANKTFNVLLIGLLIIISAGCKIEEEVFELSSISPGSKVSHLPSFTLTVNGSGFIEDSVVIFNGEEKPTGYIDSKKLTCEIDTADITPLTFTAPSVSTVRSESYTVSVSVHNPGEEGGADSNTLDFVISDNHSFSTPVSIDTRSIEFLDPALAVDDSGNIYVVYRCYDSSSGLFAIDFTRSTDSGETWETPVRLAETLYGCDNPCIALDSEGNINTAFSGAGAVYFMRSQDGGTTWTSPVQRSNQSDEPLEPAIAVDSDNVVIIAWPQKDYYYNYPVYFIRSANGGASWNPGKNIFAGCQSAVGVWSPNIALDNNDRIYVSWSFKTGGGGQYSCLNRTYDSGVTWNNTDIALGKYTCSDIAAAPNGDIYSVLASPRDGDIQDIVFRKSTNRGSSWSEEINITCDRSASAPGMVIDRAGNINVIYCCEEFLFSRSTNEGGSWSTEIQVTDDGAGDIDMAVDALGTLYFIYVDENSRHLYFMRSNL
jgi:hypothetical protein